jgi:hypothetical protein
VFLIEKEEEQVMAMIFYPHEDDLEMSSIKERLEVLLEAAEQYKAAILDIASKIENVTPETQKSVSPRTMLHAFNWQEMAKLMRELRDLPEGNETGRATKAAYLTKLAEIYEVLRAAKMPKLEAVRLALINEAKQLHSSSGA